MHVYDMNTHRFYATFFAIYLILCRHHGLWVGDIQQLHR